MRRLLVVLLVPLLVGVLLWPGYAEPLKLVQAKLVDSAGAPVANQAVIVEGKKQLAWYQPSWLFSDKVRVLGVTDASGAVQIVDLPPGKYTLKLADLWAAKLTPIKDFQLAPGYKSANFTETLKLKIPPEAIRLNESFSTEIIRKAPTSEGTPFGNFTK